MPNVHGQESRPSYVGIPTYLGAPLALSASELREMTAEVAIIGAPVDMVVHRPGTRFGPRAIRQAGYFGSPNDHVYHMGLGVYPTQVLKVVDFGDANCSPTSLESSHTAIQEKVAETLDAGAIPVVLGGDHSLVLPSATAVAQHYGFGKVGMVHFDAHADTGDVIHGSLISHASPMRRLIESGAIPGKNFLQVGLRGYCPGQDVFSWMQEQGMRWHQMSEIEARGFDVVLEDAIGEALEGPEYTYLSVDIDILDPAFAPGAGTPEPGGISAAWVSLPLAIVVKPSLAIYGFCKKAISFKRLGIVIALGVLVWLSVAIAHWGLKIVVEIWNWMSEIWTAVGTVGAGVELLLFAYLTYRLQRDQLKLLNMNIRSSTFSTIESRVHDLNQFFDRLSRNWSKA